MTQVLIGRYRVTLSSTAEAREKLLGLRALAFRPNGGSDADRFDTVFQHLLVEEAEGGQVLGGCRLRLSGRDFDDSYSAQFYDLTNLPVHLQRCLEVGRFCLHPRHADPEVLRAVWAVLAQLVIQQKVDLLFGCSSFQGCDAAPYGPALAQLAGNHLTDLPFRPKVERARIIPFAEQSAMMAAPSPPALPLPPLLRSYLQMGGRVSPEAVIDPDLDTFHVLTLVDVAAIPPARARALRLLAELSVKN